MSRATTDAKTMVQSVTTLVGERHREIALLALLLLCTFSMLSLMGYTATDPTWLHPSTGRVENPCGPLGAVLADALHTTFGHGAYAMFGAMVLCVLALAGRPVVQFWKMVWAGFVSFWCLAALELVLRPGGSYPPGGKLGELQIAVLEASVGTVGAALVTSGAILLGSTLLFEIRWRRAFEWIVERAEAGTPVARRQAAAVGTATWSGMRAVAGASAVASMSAAGLGWGAASSAASTSGQVLKRMGRSLIRRDEDEDEWTDGSALEHLTDAPEELLGLPSAEHTLPAMPVAVVEVQWDHTATATATSASSADVMGMFPDLAPRSRREDRHDPFHQDPPTRPSDEDLAPALVAPQVVAPKAVTKVAAPQAAAPQVSLRKAPSVRLANPAPIAVAGPDDDRLLERDPPSMAHHVDAASEIEEEDEEPAPRLALRPKASPAPVLPLRPKPVSVGNGAIGRPKAPVSAVDPTDAPAPPRLATPAARVAELPVAKPMERSVVTPAAQAPVLPEEVKARRPVEPPEDDEPEVDEDDLVDEDEDLDDEDEDLDDEDLEDDEDLDDEDLEDDEELDEDEDEDDLDEEDEDDDLDEEDEDEDDEDLEEEDEAPQPRLVASSAAPRLPVTPPRSHAPVPQVPEVAVRPTEFVNKRVRDDGGKAVADIPRVAFELPDLELLDIVPPQKATFDEDELREKAAAIVETLAHFNVDGEVTDIRVGPVVTIFEFLPGPGVRVNKIKNLANDLLMSLKARSVRIVAPIPGKGVVGIEVPSAQRLTIYLRELMASSEFMESRFQLPVVIGKDVEGAPVILDLAKMPHLLIGGTTGSGKSVGVNGLLMSLIYRHTPETLRMMLVDPKKLEFSMYQDIPHLLHPVVTDPKIAGAALTWACKEMDERYDVLARWNVRNIVSYNEAVERELKHWTPEKARKYAPKGWPEDQEPNLPEKMPYIVIVIDELADLMMQEKKEVEVPIVRLAQKARACGIHLILATQRPSVDVVTGLIKSNMPTRIAYKLRQNVDSRTILDTPGAETLLGGGDLLLLPNGGDGALMRCHGAFVSDGEVERVIDHVKSQGAPRYIDALTAEPDNAGNLDADGEERDPMFDEAVEIVTRAGKASTSLIQRHLKIGYNRAARIVEALEIAGIVGPADGARPREVLIK